MSTGDLPHLSCAKIRLVLRGRDSSDWSISGGLNERILFGSCVCMYSETTMVWIFLMFCVILSSVGCIVSLLISMVLCFKLWNIVPFIHLNCVSG